MARHDDPDLPPLQHRLLRAISQRIQWRNQIRQAQQQAGADPPADVPATGRQLDREEATVEFAPRGA
jgi:hypothetical protein